MSIHKTHLSDLNGTYREVVEIHYGKLGKKVPKYIHGYTPGRSEERQKIARMQADGKLFTPIEVRVKD